MAVAAFVLVAILLMVRYGRGFIANIAVLLGIVAGCVVAVAMVDGAKATAAAAAASAAATGASAPALRLPGPIPMVDNPNYGALDNMAIAAFVLVVILLITRYSRGFLANISVLLGRSTAPTRSSTSWDQI